MAPPHPLSPVLRDPRAPELLTQSMENTQEKRQESHFPALSQKKKNPAGFIPFTPLLQTLMGSDL